MNATILYTQLSREIFDLSTECNDEKLNNLMKSDRGLYKLRSFLLCRVCRELCVEPFGVSFCQHLVCKGCLEQKNPRNPGCKWCRNEEELVEDVQGKILIGLYKQLCAILKDTVTETDDDDDGENTLSGTSSSAREKLLKFLNEGCSLPDFIPPKISMIEEIDTINYPKTVKKGRGRKMVNNLNKSTCPPCCCKCGKKSETVESKQQEHGPTLPDISNDPIKVTAAQSSEERIKEAKTVSELYASSDKVSSTVPDTLTTKSSKRTKIPNKNKDGAYNKNKRVALEREKINKDKLVNKRGRGRPRLKLLPTEKKHKDSIIKDNKLKPSKKYDTDLPQKPGKALKKYETQTTDLLLPLPQSDLTSSFILKDELTEPSEYENINIPEKYPATNNSLSLNRKKLHSSDDSKKRNEIIANERGGNYKKEVFGVDSPPRIQPLKLTVKKIDNTNNVSYKIQQNSTSENDIDPPPGISQENKIETFNKEGFRKVKRKATFVTNYAVFSDDSDFELDLKKPKKTALPQVKKTREACGCGAGANVKFFTDICKRQRCPCYSQGRACVNCKCRFCSNPYLLEDEFICTDESDSSSSSSESDTGTSVKWPKNEAEHVDVESM